MKITGFFVAGGLFAISSMATPVFAQDLQARTERRMSGMDTDADGVISLAEFTEFRRGWTKRRDDAEMQMRPDVVQRAFDRIDADGNGSISFTELAEDTRATQSRR